MKADTVLETSEVCGSCETRGAAHKDVRTEPPRKSVCGKVAHEGWHIRATALNRNATVGATLVDLKLHVAVNPHRESSSEVVLESCP